VKVLDAFFTGRRGWAEQILLSAQVIDRANREWNPPGAIYTEKAAKTAYWEVSDGEIRMVFDFPIQEHQSLLPASSIAHRVIAYNTVSALDIGIDRELVTEFKGMPVQDDLMATAGLVTLEQRTSYLLNAWWVYQEFVAEWNFFADLQENLWLKIYQSEGAITFEKQQVGANYAFTETGGLGGTVGGIQVYLESIRWIPDVDRDNYEAAITQWLMDSGTTARSGGVAVSNDTYIEWLAERLQEITTDRSQVADRSIDPRLLYRVPPVLNLGAATDGDGGGPTGTSDAGFADPGGTTGRSGLDLIEEMLAAGAGNLTSSLGSGPAAEPINTLPEC
jgi:hypothetical protein